VPVRDPVEIARRQTSVGAELAMRLAVRRSPLPPTMPIESDRFHVAARVRALLAGQDDGQLGETARRLGVEDLALRITVDERSPHPVLDVLTAIIACYGVDPSWLLTGQYDMITHRSALAGDRRAVSRAVEKIAETVAERNEIRLVRDSDESPDTLAPCSPE
jgi:hypothetical protein